MKKKIRKIRSGEEEVLLEGHRHEGEKVVQERGQCRGGGLKVAHANITGLMSAVLEVKIV